MWLLKFYDECLSQQQAFTLRKFEFAFDGAVLRQSNGAKREHLKEKKKNLAIHKRNMATSLSPHGYSDRPVD